MESICTKVLPSSFLSSCESDSDLLEDRVIYRLIFILTCNVSSIQAEQSGLDPDSEDISFKAEEDDDYKAPQKKILRNQNINSDL